ncbi:carbohydrate ABC transporter permease [Cohnella abietis]|uniref:Sugar ABC transporter permease n=1 Tax=Cohnella abietis TaxID=2507935 RepID=A0A3T1D272_9BACL|nr:sugar ABC transporter permease [Cohnella abietis]BBI32148.1 sugar ABC transporter permease [Cohnella abietis]
MANYQLPLPRANKKRSMMKSRDSMVLLLLIAPAFIILLVLSMGPLMHSIYTGMFSSNLAKSTKTFVGFGNYKEIMQDTYFWNAFFNTLYQVFGTVGIQLLVGMGIALLLARTFKGVKILRSLYLLPMMTTPIVVGLVWRMLYNPELGLINYYLDKIGISGPNWLGDPSWAMPSIILADVWLSTPFLTMILLAGLQTLPTEPYESAELDGANRFQTFWYITMPLLKPYIYMAILFRLMDAIKRFDTIYIMTGGGPGNKTETLNIYVYHQAFEFLKTGYAAALSNVMLVFILVISIYFLRKIQKS